MPVSTDTGHLKGRAVSRLLEIFGWLASGLGVVLLAAGLWSLVAPGAWLAAYGLLASAVLIALGIVIGLAGLIAVQQALTARAIFQSARDTRALLAARTTPTAPRTGPSLRAEPTFSRPAPSKNATP